MAERRLQFEIAGATVTLPAPPDAAFEEVEGLPEGDRNLTWTADGGFFVLSSATGPGHTPDGLLDGERSRAEAFELLSDEPAPLAGEGARRVAFRSAHRRPREREAGGAERDEELVTRVGDFLFVPGPRRTVRAGYRADGDAPVRPVLAQMLDGVEVAW